jgi:(E)-4-hydroxy-3-methylbut-2-enyl-diphosphate synthase
VDLGSVIIDGMGDGIWLENDHPSTGTRELRSISFRLLQSAGVRISATEYIACPSCGRTLFNIQETLKRVKAATRELTGVKIAVMGCIVNGPGEMADADYGYVGAGPGRVTLYKGSEAVKKNIPEGEAVDELLRIIHREESP